MSTAKPADEWPIYPGGLMRCCIETIVNCAELKDVGDLLDCKYEHKPTMELRADGWHWYGPPASAEINEFYEAMRAAELQRKP
jgi:hypothetical protein